MTDILMLVSSGYLRVKEAASSPQGQFVGKVAIVALSLGVAVTAAWLSEKESFYGVSTTALKSISIGAIVVSCVAFALLCIDEKSPTINFERPEEGPHDLLPPQPMRSSPQPPLSVLTTKPGSSQDDHVDWEKMIKEMGDEEERQRRMQVASILEKRKPAPPQKGEPAPPQKGELAG